jgi:hypothetical protein
MRQPSRVAPRLQPDIDQTALPIDGRQCRMARAAVAWSRRDLNRAARVGLSTITKFENGQPIRPVLAHLIVAAFEAAGTEFVRIDGCRAVAVRIERTLSAITGKQRAAPGTEEAWS